MGNKVVCGVYPAEVADMMEFVHRIVEKRSKQPFDVLALSLTVSESLVLLLKDNWSYEEDFGEAINEARKMARCTALQLYSDVMGDRS